MRIGEWQVDVMIGGMPMPVEAFGGKTYVCIPRNAEFYEKEVEETDPYGEPFKQIYRYTPFTIEISEPVNDIPVTVKVFVDGNQVHSNVMNKGHRHCVRGIKTPQGLKQLVFSPPRVAPPSASKKKNEDLGTIRIEFYRTSFLRVEERSRGRTFDFQGATKKDCKDTGVVSTVTAGNVIGQTEVARRRHLYRAVTEADLIESLVVHYATEYQLEWLKPDDLVKEEPVEPRAKRVRTT